jgi:hypothetical protein
MPDGYILYTRIVFVRSGAVRTRSGLNVGSVRQTGSRARPRKSLRLFSQPQAHTAAPSQPSGAINALQWQKEGALGPGGTCARPARGGCTQRA